MNKNLTEMVFILDRSGSMASLVSDTIGGYNSLIEKQKTEEGEAAVTTVLFDDQYDVVCENIDINKVEPMTNKVYFARGMTALLDAIGKTVNTVAARQQTAVASAVPAKTVVVIMTDGMENASRIYSYDKVRRMIEHEKEKYHWEFLFLGANMDAIKVAGRFGIRASRAVNYENDGVGTQLNYEVMSKAVSCARMSATATDMEAAFDKDELFAPIREDYKRRHRK